MLTSNIPKMNIFIYFSSGFLMMNKKSSKLSLYIYYIVRN
nr:MAG TPA: hypothetical protein [Caudoviricetes sp.]